MAYIDLVNELSALDKQRIVNYIDKYGINKKYFIGLDEWLQNWSHSKQKLYKLLGNKLTRSFEFEIEKSPELTTRDIENWIDNSRFVDSLSTFYRKHIEKYSETEIDRHTKDAFYYIACRRFTIVEMFRNNHSYYGNGIKFKAPGAKKMLQIPSGMKPMRVYQKFVDYFKELYPEDITWALFNEFNVQYAQILNEKTLKGNLVVSIHPLDYITMSDNSLNWQSCMSWIDKGCYRVGTIETMNSNNVLCCYLESNNNFFHFGVADDGYFDPTYTWNNKKWRQLVYVNKDIIMSGKSYPYYNYKITEAVLKFVKELAEENLGWKYSFGIEKYQDMKHVYSQIAMDNNREWIATGHTKKHNILWDTKGMYNDMLNDNEYSYWCYRNKVPHNKIYSVSGKCNCLRCNGQIITENNNRGYNSYNERFFHVGQVICEDCAEDFHCEICGSHDFRGIVTPVKIKHFHVTGVEKITTRKICPNCRKTIIKRCPDCGKLIYFDGDSMYYSQGYSFWLPPGGWKDVKEKNGKLTFSNTKGIFYIEPRERVSDFDYKEAMSFEEERTKRGFDPELSIYYRPIFMWMCKDCLYKHEDAGDFISIVLIHSRGGRSNKTIKVFKKDTSPEVYEKYLSFNLQEAEGVENIDTIYSTNVII